jgi:hypothetical protein
MFSHNFKPIPYWQIGPIINRYGWIICAAEIGESWFLKWRTAQDQEGFAFYADHESVIDAIEQLNRQASIERGE